MEYTPEISVALDIFAEEATTANESGKVLTIYSDSGRIKKELTHLFENVLDINANLTSWARNVCKYGDNFIYNKIVPNQGIVGVTQLPNIEMTRSEPGFSKVTSLDDQQKEIRTYSSKDKEGPATEKGFNQFAWNLYHKELEQPEAGFILWNGSTSPVLAAPGKYTANITIDKQLVSYPFEIIADPNFKVSNADLKEQEQFLLQVAGSFKEIMNTLKGAKEIKSQIAVIQKKTKDSTFIASAKAVNDMLTKIEEALHQTKAKSGQDVLNFPIRLDDKIAGVFESAAAGYVAPTKQVKETYLELKQQVDEQLKKFETIKKENVKALNDKVHQLSIPIIGN